MSATQEEVVVNPYKAGRFAKPEFHYTPWHVQLTIWLEDAGVWKIVDADKHPGFAEGAFYHSLGMPVGLNDNAIYVIAFSSLLFAAYLFLSGGHP